MTKKYLKKPIAIEAFRFYVDAMPDWFTDRVSENDILLHNCNYDLYSKEEAYCLIKTLEGNMIGNGGDWIIKGVNGEIYPCKPDIFAKTYVEAEEEEVVTITKREYYNLLSISAKLTRLEAYGVDNWSGYGEAMSDSEGIFGEEEEEE